MPPPAARARTRCRLTRFAASAALVVEWESKRNEAKAKRLEAYRAKKRAEKEAAEAAKAGSRPPWGTAAAAAALKTRSERRPRAQRQRLSRSKTSGALQQRASRPSKEPSPVESASSAAGDPQAAPAVQRKRAGKARLKPAAHVATATTRMAAAAGRNGGGAASTGAAGGAGGMERINRYDTSGSSVHGILESLQRKAGRQWMRLSGVAEDAFSRAFAAVLVFAGRAAVGRAACACRAWRARTLSAVVWRSIAAAEFGLAPARGQRPPLPHPTWRDAVRYRVLCNRNVVHGLAHSTTVGEYRTDTR